LISKSKESLWFLSLQTNQAQLQRVLLSLAMQPATQKHVGAILLYIVLVLIGIMFGASVYQRISIIPEWGGALPESVVTYFRGTNNGQAMDRFWTSITAPTAIAIVLALGLNWHPAVRRRWIALGAVLIFLMLVWTAVFFIPNGVIPLMQRGGEGLARETITQMAESWIFWDWFRMAITLGAYLCFIKAVSLQNDR
jgi:hypothetical protein